MTGDETQTPETVTPPFALETLLNPQALGALRQAAEISREHGVTINVNTPGTGSGDSFGRRGGEGATLSITPAWATPEPREDPLARVERHGQMQLAAIASEGRAFVARMGNLKRLAVPLFTALLGVIKKIPGGDDKDSE